MRWIVIIMLVTARIYHPDTVPQSHNGLITVPASKKYSSPSLLGKIFSGSNYRREWETPVTMPVFDIKKTNFRIVKMGGGQQTTSLDLIDDKNREWTLRSVDKNVQTTKKYAQNIFIQSIIQDGVSGSYPYAGLSVPDIAHAAGVPGGEQHLYFVPDDSAFGEYRSMMANKVFILVNNQSENGITTTAMLEKLKSDRQSYVDQKEYLKARLVDWPVADWDRHINQLRWTEKRTDSGIAFLVVPRDHDQAFFRSNGLLLNIVSLFKPHFNKFTDDGRGIEALSEKTRYLDKQFTDQLQKEDWEMIIKQFQNNVTDGVIETAIKKQPKEIFAIRGNELIRKLKSRRDGLLKHALEYYSFLNKLK